MITDVIAEYRDIFKGGNFMHDKAFLLQIECDQNNYDSWPINLLSKDLGTFFIDYLLTSLGEQDMTIDPNLINPHVSNFRSNIFLELDYYEAKEIRHFNETNHLKVICSDGYFNDCVSLNAILTFRSNEIVMEIENDHRSLIDELFINPIINIVWSINKRKVLDVWEDTGYHLKLNQTEKE